MQKMVRMCPSYVPMFISPHLPNENLKQYNLPHIFILRLFLITNIKYYELEARQSRSLTALVSKWDYDAFEITLYCFILVEDELTS